MALVDLLQKNRVTDQQFVAQILGLIRTELEIALTLRALTALTWFMGLGEAAKDGVRRSVRQTTLIRMGLAGGEIRGAEPGAADFLPWLRVVGS